MQDISFEEIKNYLSIIAIFLTIVAITIAGLNFYVGNWWRLRKSLAYEIVTFTAIVGIQDKVKDRVKILFDGKEIPNAQLYEIKIINDGKQPIEKKDFEKPLEIVFDSDAEIFSAEVMETQPSNLSLDYKIEKNKIVVEPLLLNKQDSFSIKGIVNAKAKDVICNARIAGIKEVSKKLHNVMFDKFLKRIWLLVGCSISFLIILESAKRYNYIGGITFQIVDTIGAIVLFLVLLAISYSSVMNSLWKRLDSSKTD